MGLKFCSIIRRELFSPNKMEMAIKNQRRKNKKTTLSSAKLNNCIVSKILNPFPWQTRIWTCRQSHSVFMLVLQISSFTVYFPTPPCNPLVLRSSGKSFEIFGLLPDGSPCDSNICICLNQVNRLQTKPVLTRLFKKYPTAHSLLRGCTIPMLEDLLEPLGMQRVRAKRIYKMSD